jgi:hypothetical protein
MNRVRLRGGLERTASSAEIDDGGRLVVECFDFSEDARDYFGNDVAFTLTVEAEVKPLLLDRLGVVPPPDGSADDALLAALAARFDGYFSVKQWLEAEGIAFADAFDPRA